MIEPSSCGPAEAMKRMLWRLNELALDPVANKINCWPNLIL
ncbi:hypothetical protein NC653_018115 [Populus alba x Populus x berolinensis]|uniref:Uncharacterized protein n=1 Tax=Populus alba x Populus x berolinensis TaxID=444605 RepID=A0AAD6QRW2_9ROSI|nr:hypothetical protein NC653_018115 [Populus alba x Populus x berolinensis]